MLGNFQEDGGHSKRMKVVLKLYILKIDAQLVREETNLCDLYFESNRGFLRWRDSEIRRRKKPPSIVTASANRIMIKFFKFSVC